MLLSSRQKLCDQEERLRRLEGIDPILGRLVREAALGSQHFALYDLETYGKYLKVCLSEDIDPESDWQEWIAARVEYATGEARQRILNPNSYFSHLFGYFLKRRQDGLIINPGEEKRRRFSGVGAPGRHHESSVEETLLAATYGWKLANQKRRKKGASNFDPFDLSAPDANERFETAIAEIED